MTQLQTRRNRRRTRPETPIAPDPAPIQPGMTGGRYKPLTEAEQQNIHALVLRLLADKEAPSAAAVKEAPYVTAVAAAMRSNRALSMAS